MPKQKCQTVQERLFNSIQEGDLENVKFCLKNGAKINAMDQKYGRSSLYIASKHGRVEIVQFLIQNGADINARSNTDRTPLYIAALDGSIEIVKMLHQNGADVNAKNNDASGWSPLHRFSHFGNLEVVKYLVQNGAMLNSKDKENKTPLDYAIFNCKDDIVKYLKEAGAQETATMAEKEANILKTKTRSHLIDYTVRFVDNVSDYESCKNCERTIDFEESFGKFCPKCKAPLAETLEEANFTFKLYLEKEDKLEQVQGFRKDLIELGSSILHDLDTDLENMTWQDLNPYLENRLNDFFGEKKVTIDYFKRKGEKFIHKIKQITKIVAEKPPTKKLKTEDI